MKTYQKPHASLDEQVAKLRDRGLEIQDEDRAKHYLSIVGYYRLSSYCYHFEIKQAGERSHRFCPGATFDDVVKLYVFDQKLRGLFMEALERIEIASRSLWSHELSKEGGAHAYMYSGNFSDHADFFKSLAVLIDEIKHSGESTEEIKHYLTTYNDPFLPPVWVGVSSMSFGELFRWIKNTRSTAVKVAIARKLGFPNIQLFEGVIKPLTTIRNICAHHGRLWDRRLQTKLPFVNKKLKVPMVGVQKNSGMEADNKLYNCILIVAHILIFLNEESTWCIAPLDSGQSVTPN